MTKLTLNNPILREANDQTAQVGDLKQYAVENYDKHGWDFVVETMTEADICDVIGKRKNSRAAIMTMFYHIQPMHEARQEARCAGEVDEEAAAAKRDREHETEQRRKAAMSEQEHMEEAEAEAEAADLAAAAQVAADRRAHKARMARERRAAAKA